MTHTDGIPGEDGRIVDDMREIVVRGCHRGHMHIRTLVAVHRAGRAAGSSIEIRRPNGEMTRTGPLVAFARFGIAPGERLTIVATGEDAAGAVERIAALLTSDACPDDALRVPPVQGDAPSSG